MPRRNKKRTYAKTRKKLLATVRRCEGVYNRTAKRSESFYERGGTVQRVTDFLHKKIGTSITCSDVVTRRGQSLAAQVFPARRP